jgi:hypothetical protein
MTDPTAAVPKDEVALKQQEEAKAAEAPAEQTGEKRKASADLDQEAEKK